MTGSKSGGLRALLLPVCWIKGHDLEEESIIKTNLPRVNYIRRCRRCNKYEIGTHMGQLIVSETYALRAKAAYDKSMADPKEDKSKEGLWT